jgi:hypothetical protein
VYLLTLARQAPYHLSHTLALFWLFIKGLNRTPFVIIPLRPLGVTLCSCHEAGLLTGSSSALRGEAPFSVTSDTGDESVTSCRTEARDWGMTSLGLWVVLGRLVFWAGGAS